MVFELGWVILASFIALWSFCVEDVSLMFIGITIIFVSTVELVLGVAVFVLINLEQGRVFVSGPDSSALKCPGHLCLLRPLKARARASRPRYQCASKTTWCGGGAHSSVEPHTLSLTGSYLQTTVVLQPCILSLLGRRGLPV